MQREIVTLFLQTDWNSLVVLANFGFAFSQPIFPGKILLWLLFMFSLVSWGIIVSKIIAIRRSRVEDLYFTKRLNRSRTALGIFEENTPEENSLKYEVYRETAREAAFQLLGSRDSEVAAHSDVGGAGKLSALQMESIQAATQRGLDRAMERLQAGMSVQKMISYIAPLIGLTGLVWMLMRGFDSSREFAQISPWVSGGLCYVLLSFAVTFPAVISLLIFDSYFRRGRAELSQFASELERLFARSFAAGKLIAPRTEAKPTQSEMEAGEAEELAAEEVEEIEAEEYVAVDKAEPDVEETPEVEQGAVDEEPPEIEEPSVIKKEYHSIRKAFEEGTAANALEPPKKFLPPDDSDPTNKLPINPIARQAAMSAEGRFD